MVEKMDQFPLQVEHERAVPLGDTTLSNFLPSRDQFEREIVSHRILKIVISFNVFLFDLSILTNYHIITTMIGSRLTHAQNSGLPLI
jgi:hypothetical protein